MDNTKSPLNANKEKVHTIAIMNSKGGSGKTTITTNLANFYASHDLKTLLVDHDSQGSSVQWLKRRSIDSTLIEATEAYRQANNFTRSWMMRVPLGTQRVLIDTPAGIDAVQMEQIAKRADTIIIPVLPSPIDIEAVSDFIRRLCKVVWVKNKSTRIAVLANRVRYNTRVYETLEKYLSSLDIPFVTTLRDTQNYIHASENGTGIHDLTKNNAKRDVAQWQALLDWIETPETNNQTESEGHHRKPTIPATALHSSVIPI